MLVPPASAARARSAERHREALPAPRLAPAPARRLAVDRDRLPVPEQPAGERQLEIHPVDQEADEATAAQRHQGRRREQRLESVVMGEGEDGRIRDLCQTTGTLDLDPAGARGENAAQERPGADVVHRVQRLAKAPGGVRRRLAGTIALPWWQGRAAPTRRIRSPSRGERRSAARRRCCRACRRSARRRARWHRPARLRRCGRGCRRR